MSAQQATFDTFERDAGRFPWADEVDDVTQRTPLTYSEAEAMVAAARVGVRKFARETNRSPGTVGNLLRRARDKMAGAR